MQKKLLLLLFVTEIFLLFLILTMQIENSFSVTEAFSTFAVNNKHKLSSHASCAIEQLTPANDDNVQSLIAIASRRK